MNIDSLQVEKSPDPELSLVSGIICYDNKWKSRLNKIVFFILGMYCRFWTQRPAKVEFRAAFVLNAQTDPVDYSFKSTGNTSWLILILNLQSVEGWMINLINDDVSVALYPALPHQLVEKDASGDVEQPGVRALVHLVQPHLTTHWFQTTCQVPFTNEKERFQQKEGTTKIFD